jgi:hypothetical protein
MKVGNIRDRRNYACGTIMMINPVYRAANENKKDKCTFRAGIKTMCLVCSVPRCLRHNLCSQPYGSKSLERSTGSAV